MKRKIYSFFGFFAVLALFSGCKPDKVAPSYNKGEMTIETDGSFKSVAEALADAYMINYPETKINVATKKEDLGFLDLLNDKAKLIIMSRDLSKQEIKAYEAQTELKFQPAKFAADAVLFVVPKNSARTEVTMEEIISGLNSGDKKFIFDGTNSSNLNFVAQKIGQKPADLKFSVIPGNEKLISGLSAFPDKIGVISLNSISRPYNIQEQALRDKIKILPVRIAGILHSPQGRELREMTYPFTRVLYFLTNEGNFNLANGIIRFSCTQKGQIVVDKEGLQPYNIFKREVQMH